MSPRRLLVVVAACTAVASLVWVWLDRRDRAPAGEEAGGTPRAAEAPNLARIGEEPASEAPSPAESAPVGDEIPLADGPPGGIGVVCRVTEEQGGSPVEGARVRLRLDAAEATAFVPLEGTTDAAGEVRFGPMPVPRVPRRLATTAALVVEDLAATSEPSGVLRSLPARIGREEIENPLPPEWRFSLAAASSPTGTRWFRLELRRAVGVPVSGRVLSSDGVGIPEALVHAGEELRGVRTGPDGGFDLLLDRGGPATVVATVMTWGSRGPTLETRLDVPEPGGLSGLAWILPGVGEVSGRAMESDGRPAAGAEVCLTRPGETVGHGMAMLFSSSITPASSYQLRRTVGDDGRFRFVGTIDGNRYDVRWWRGEDDDPVGAAGVLSGTRDVEVRLERHGVLPRAVDALDGRPVYGDVLVRAGESESKERGSFWPDQEGFLAPSGTTVSILVRAVGYADAAVEHVVSDVPGLDLVPVFLHPTDRRARVRLRCTDERGTPLPWPVARFTHEASGIRVSPQGRVEEGAFATSDLDAGAHRVATWDSYGMSDTPDHAGLPMSGPLRFVVHGETRFEVPREATLDVSWVLREGGALRIAVRSATGDLLEPGDLRSVRARDAYGKDFRVRLFHRDARDEWQAGTGVAAVYESQAVPAGSYDVTWHSHGGDGAPSLATSRAVVRARETTPVDLVADASPR